MSGREPRILKSSPLKSISPLGIILYFGLHKPQEDIEDIVFLRF